MTIWQVYCENFGFYKISVIMNVVLKCYGMDAIAMSTKFLVASVFSHISGNLFVYNISRKKISKFLLIRPISLLPIISKVVVRQMQNPITCNIISWLTICCGSSCFYHLLLESRIITLNITNTYDKKCGMLSFANFLFIHFLYVV